MLKNDILSILNIKDVANYYGIKVEKNMCRCPLGHKDKTPSMRIYDNTNTFYCFSCNKSGDLIELVQSLFNLNFQQAMEKINDDFNLGLTKKSTYNKKQLLELQKKQEIVRLQEKYKKEMENRFFSSLCKRRLIYIDLYKYYCKNINIYNWEDFTCAKVYLQQKIFLIDQFIYEQYKIL